MAEKFHFGVWNYLPIEESKLDDVNDWAECGLTTTIAPSITLGKNDPRKLIPYLDRAERFGIKLIINVTNLAYDTYVKEGAAEYERKFREVHECLKGHPALYGYVIGDEPSTPEYLEASKQCIKIQKKIAPETMPYLNFSGPRTKEEFGPEHFGGRTYSEWLCDVVKETGHKEFCFDEYCQTIGNEEALHGFFRTIKQQVDAAEAADADMWACLLLSSHGAFCRPTEFQLMWQITMAAALGCKGVFWFRFYDRDYAPGYHGSPIDEFGFKTEAYYNLLRCQRRFSTQFGEIIMKLKRKKSYILKNSRGDYPVFKPGDHEYILDATIDDTGVLSFFEDEEGKEYICIVNGCMKYFASSRIKFDNTKCTLTEITNNGKIELPFGCDKYGVGELSNEYGVYPGQMRLFRIDKF